MELSWFRKPGPDRSGTTNLCYNALDRHIVAGAATEPALLTGAGPVDFATALEQVSALAGVFRGVGVGPGDAVVVAVDEQLARALALLAVLRLGAVAYLDADPHGLHPAPRLLVTSRETPAPDGVVRLLRGVAPADPRWDLDWDLALRAGREDPAPCADVAPDQPAYVVGGEQVGTLDAFRHESFAGRLLASLVAGRAAQLEAGDLEAGDLEAGFLEEGR